MVSYAIIFAFVANILPALTSPVVSSGTQTCTTTINKMPSYDRDCTFYAELVTTSTSVDCGGCALATNYLGFGSPCQQITTIAGSSTTTVTACAASPVSPGPLGAALAKYDEPSSTSALITASGDSTTVAPTPTCTIEKLGTFGPLVQATCTFYDQFVTTTVSEDCGGHPGCAVATLDTGHGPEVRCGTYTNLPTGTATATYCTA